MFSRVFAASLQRSLVLAGLLTPFHTGQYFCGYEGESFAEGTHVDENIYAKWSRSRQQFNRLAASMGPSDTVEALTWKNQMCVFVYVVVAGHRLGCVL